MAVARSCLTLWVYRILVPMIFGPPITGPSRSWEGENRMLVGERDGASRLGLVQVS